MTAEISYDLVMADDMEFIEGVYRLSGERWKVVVVSRGDVPATEVVPQVWDSGAGGVMLRVPREIRLNAAVVEAALSSALGVTEWVRAVGPDSIQLR